jgi:hypothetical protein
MTKELISAARRELANLKDQVKGDPRYIKIQRLEELLAVYLSAPSAEHKPAPRPTTGAATKAAAISDAITGLLQNGPVHRSEILAHLVERDIMGHEKRPMKHLASFLSAHREQFESDGAGNFRLRSAPPTSRGNGLFESDTGRSPEEPAGHEIGA